MDPAPGGSNDIYVWALTFFGVIWALFAVPYAFHVVRAAVARDAWLPFEPKANGGYTFMARKRWFAAFRAPRPEDRTTTGLVVRHVIWVWVVAALGYLPFHVLREMLSR